MIEGISKLPNYCNGKLYKRWNHVTSIFGGGVLASKNTKNNDTIELLISESGKKRELYFSNGKIMDIIDNSGIKRTFNYEKSGEEIHGSMMVANVSDAIKPLVTSAKWITNGLMPKIVELTINPKHKLSKVYVPDIKSGGGFPAILDHRNSIRTVKVKAEDFEDVSYPLPKKITLTTSTGEEKVIESSSGAENILYANHFGLTHASEPGANLRVFV